jgi:hypothetical protein
VNGIDNSNLGQITCTNDDFTKVNLRKSSSEQGEKLQGLAVMGELDDRWPTFYKICSTDAGNFEIYNSFNSISKISYVRNSKLFFRQHKKIHRV